MNKVRFYQLVGIAFSVCLFSSGFAQKKFNLTINFPAELDKSKLWISYDNGKVSDVLPLIGNRVIASGEYFSEFVSIQITYPRENGAYPYYYKGFFIKDQPAVITFSKLIQSKSPFLNCELSNAYDFDSMGAKDERAFIADEEDDFTNFLTLYNDKMRSSDSLQELSRIKNKKLLERKLEYVKTKGNSYYSFWLFRTELCGSGVLVEDTLIRVFNSVFPEYLKQSTEGNEILKIIYGAGLKKGSVAPEFSASDINGNAIHSKAFKGKYLLLDFWASWCAPCIEEIPIMTQIRSNNKDDLLKMVSISLDQNKSAFSNIVSKFEMNWIHILNDKEIIKLYGAYSVPAVYLIDPNGVILYSREQENDFNQLTKLRRIIETLKDRK